MAIDGFLKKKIIGVATYFFEKTMNPKICTNSKDSSKGLIMLKKR
jgi:hypothetical protein